MDIESRTMPSLIVCIDSKVLILKVMLELRDPVSAYSIFLYACSGGYICATVKGF